MFRTSLSPEPWGTVAALGITQITAWGSIYYVFSLLMEQQQTDLHASKTAVVGAFSVALLVAGLLAPLVGRTIDRYGGRALMTTGSIVAGIALIALGQVTTIAQLYIVWVVLGAAMAATLYEPAFAVLTRLFATGYRRAITVLTLFGGFASTVFWPFTQLLIDHYGWRDSVAIHSLATEQAQAAFVAVNCGAIPDALLEDAFFGHERGAFTGADRLKKGYLEQANGGTLFLDEIGDLPLSMQVKLLRVIQDRKVRRIGSETSVPVDIRVYCATNRDLTAMVRAGGFRDDLYYRINVVHLKVPALRDRPEDVLWLAHKFLEEQGTRLLETPRLLTLGAQSALIAHAWPGNVRELRNKIERACVLSPAVALTAADLFEDEDAEHTVSASALPSLDAFVADAERTYIASVLRRLDGRIGAAAAALKISRKTLWEKMKRYGMRGADQEFH